MLITLFCIIWLSIPIWILLLITKRIRGYYFYGTKRFNRFWETYNYASTYRTPQISTVSKTMLSIGWHTSTFHINTHGLYMHHSFGKRRGVLIFFNESKINTLSPPAYAFFQSYKVRGNCLVIKCKTTKQIINADLSIELQNLDPFTQSKLTKELNEHINTLS